MIRKCHIQMQRSIHHPEAKSTTPLAPPVCVFTCRDDSRYQITIIPVVGANYQDYFINVQSVVIDAMDRLWILDAGRPSTPSGSGTLSSHGGVKLVGIDLSTNTVFTTITFPATVAYPDSVSLPPSCNPCVPTRSMPTPLTQLEFQRRPLRSPPQHHSFRPRHRLHHRL